MNALRYVMTISSMKATLAFFHELAHVALLCTVAPIAVTAIVLGALVILAWIALGYLARRLGLIASLQLAEESQKRSIADTHSVTQPVELPGNEALITRHQYRYQVLERVRAHHRAGTGSSITTYHSGISTSADQVEPAASNASRIQSTDDTAVSAGTECPAFLSATSTASSGTGSVKTAIEEQAADSEVSAKQVKKEEAVQPASFAKQVKKEEAVQPASFERNHIPTSCQQKHIPTPGRMSRVSTPAEFQLHMPAFHDDPVLADLYKQKQKKAEAEEAAKRKVSEQQLDRDVPKVLYKATRRSAASVKSPPASVKDDRPKTSTGHVETLIDGKIWHMRPEGIQEHRPMSVSAFVPEQPKIAPHRRKHFPVKKEDAQNEMINKLREKNEINMAPAFEWHDSEQYMQQLQRASEIKEWNARQDKVRGQFPAAEKDCPVPEPKSSAPKKASDAQPASRFQFSPPKSKLSAQAAAFTPSVSQHGSTTAVSPVKTYATAHFKSHAPASVKSHVSSKSPDHMQPLQPAKLNERKVSTFTTPQVLTPMTNSQIVRAKEVEEDYDSPSSVWAGLDQF